MPTSRPLRPSVLSVLPVLSVLLLTGAGCLQIKTATSSTGGMFATVDAGAKWTSKSLLPVAAGVQSINTTDVLNIAFDPSDDDALYIGTRENGLLYSYDNAESWARVEESELREGKINGVAVHAKEKCTYYVAKGAKVMKTTDCGRTFDTQVFVETRGKEVLVIRADWYNPETVWIGTADGDIVKSVDGGKTWSTVYRVDDIKDLMIDNADSRIILVATDGDGIYRTTDSGANWTEIKDSLREWRSSEDGLRLAQNKDGSMMYYANKYGILRSSDHGATWEGLTLLTAPKSVTIYSLAVNPEDGNDVYYGTATTFYSTTDGGTTWNSKSLPTSRTASALMVDPDSTDTILLGVAAVEKK